jgi:hypothetical protein
MPISKPVIMAERILVANWFHALLLVLIQVAGGVAQAIRGSA